MFLLIFFCLFVGGTMIYSQYLRSKTAVRARSEAELRLGSIAGSEGFKSSTIEQAENTTKEPLSRQLARWLYNRGTLDSEGASEVASVLRRKLILAGKYPKMTPLDFIAQMLLLWSGSIAVLVFAKFALALPSLLVAIAAVVIFAYPYLKLQQLIGRRQDRAKLELPSFINEMIMNLTSGQSTIDDALDRMVRENSGSPGKERVLITEFGQAYNEYRYGAREREEALVDAAKRIGVMSVENFVDSLIQGLKTGTPIRKILRSQNDQVQHIFKQDMRAYIGKKQSSFIISLVMILGGVVVLIATPIFLQVLGAFS